MTAAPAIAGADVRLADARDALPALVAAPPPGAARAALPTPRQLAALGAVLCLHRAQSGGALGGWAQAVRAEVAHGVDSDGVHGEIRFVDRDGRCCWRLFLLPDGDFLAWDRLCATLPRCDAGGDAPVAERLWRRLATRLRGGWSADVLRLHALPLAPGFSQAPMLLAASLGVLSHTGVAFAHRLLAAEGVPADALATAAAADDCCCRGAARVDPPQRGVRDDTPSYTLVRLKREQA